MSTAVAVARGRAPHAARLLARLLAGGGALALVVSVFLPWDAGLRDSVSECGWFCHLPQLRASDLDGSSALGLLVPFGVALVAIAAGTARARR